MKLHSLNRKVHYWISFAVALPALVIFCTGILLQMKKQFAWVQPAELRGSGSEPALEFFRILEICRNVPEAEAREWADINRVDSIKSAPTNSPEPLTKSRFDSIVWGVFIQID
jgi:hypothetical protein